MTPCRYLPVERLPHLPSGTVHIWCAPLEQPPTLLAGWEQTLSAEEKTRAANFHFSRHRRRYVAAHGVLRTLVAHYLAKPLQDIKFSYSEYGKPCIDGRLKFNMSHSADIALIAFCLDAELGIDLERVRVMNDAASIASRFFAPAEYERYQALPQSKRRDAFFACWTRKEAFIKAIGEGLSYPLDAFEVSFGQDQPAQLQRIGGREEEARNWSLYDLAPLDGYAAALAVEGRDWQLDFHQFVASSIDSI